MNRLEIETIYTKFTMQFLKTFVVFFGCVIYVVNFLFWLSLSPSLSLYLSFNFISFDKQLSLYDPWKRRNEFTKMNLRASE